MDNGFVSRPYMLPGTKEDLSNVLKAFKMLKEEFDAKFRLIFA